MSRIRVVHVVEAMHQGGAESLVVEHVRHAGSGFQLSVCALNRGGPALEAVEGLGASAFVLGREGGPISRVRRLAERLRRERVDVVNGHNPTGALYATLAARLAGVPVVLRTEHSLHYPNRHSRVYPLLVEPVVTVLTRRVVCVCQAVLESHASRLPWAAGRFVTVANGISPAPRTRPRETVRPELGLPPGAPVVLTVASLTLQKDQGTLLDAFARVVTRLPEARLLIAGDGPLRPALEERTRALGLEDRVRFLGARADVAELLEAADVFALSSIREGMPVTVLEAMRAGRAVVATAVGGSAEVVLDGETGRIAPPRDPGALGDALLEVLGDPARAAALGAAGRRRWAERFTAERMVAATEAIYRAELQRSRGLRPAEREPVKERHASA